jgi:hypothetical protein
MSELREMREAIRAIGFWRCAWAMTGYRPTMKLAHRFNWHHVVKLGPFEDGPTQQWCQWCGLRDVRQKSVGEIPRE